MTSYKRPPITEAVITIMFTEPEQVDVYDKHVSVFSPDYPRYINTRNFEMNLNIPAEVTVQAHSQLKETNGLRLSNDEETEILVIWPKVLVISQLAPYMGWDSFFGRFTRDWKSWKRSFGYRKIAQIGLRFINRIDIPHHEGITEESEYLRFFISYPSSLGIFTSYGAQGMFPAPDINGRIIINSGVVPSPLMAHSSILFDLDIACDVDVPQNDDDITSQIGLMRQKKNAVFEDCITNKARELFNS